MHRYTGRRVAATLLSLIALPGLGHLLLGKSRRAVFWMVVVVALTAAAPYSMTALLAAVVMRLPCVLDLWLLRVTEPPRLGRAVRVIVVVMIPTTILSVLARAYYSESYGIPSSSMSPTLEIGDHVMTTKIAVEPALGDLVVFQHPCVPDTAFLKRVVALPGDSVEVRCDRLHVNGERAPARLADSHHSYLDYDIDGEWFEVLASRYVETLGGRSYSVLSGADRPARDLARDESNDAQAGLDHVGDRDFPGATPPGCFGTSEPGPGAIVEKQEGDGPCALQRHYVVPADHIFVLGDNRDNSADSRVWGPVPLDDVEGLVRHIWWSSAAGDIRLDRLGAVH